VAPIVFFFQIYNFMDTYLLGIAYTHWCNKRVIKELLKCGHCGDYTFVTT